MSRQVVAVFVRRPERGAELADRLDRNAYETIVLGTGDELYRILNARNIDYLVVEHDLESFFTGLELVERVHKDLLRPKTILLILPSGNEPARIRALGIDAVLGPNCSIAAIQKAIEDLGKLGTGRVAFIPALARQVVSQSPEIPPLPQLIVKLASYLTDIENISMENLANDISVDQRITADLLKLMNSASLGVRRKFTTVFDAVNLLGVRPTIALVLASTALRTKVVMAETMSEVDRTWYQERAVLIASAAYCFAKHVGGVSPDTAYVLGLFQEFGILLLANHFDEAYIQLLGRTREKGSVRLEALEHSSFGITHADVGAALLQKWAMPATMVNLVLHHHQESAGQATGPDVERRYLHIMQVGEALANLGDGHAQIRYPHFKKLINAYGVANREKCQEALRETIDKSVESIKLFQIPIPRPEVFNAVVAKMMEQTAGTSSVE